MLLVLHGEDIIGSRHELDRQKQNYSVDQIHTFDEQPQDLTILTQITNSNQLFGASGDKLIVFEGILEKGLSEQLVSWITSSLDHNQIVIWENHQIGKSTKKTSNKQASASSFIRKLEGFGSNVKVLQFRTNILFDFLESLYPGNLKKALRLSAELAANYSFYDYFPLLVDHFRYLIYLGLLSSKQDLAKLHPFRLQKLKIQYKLSSNQNLIQLYQCLYNWELSEKFTRLSWDEGFNLSSDYFELTKTRISTYPDYKMSLDRFVILACQV